MATTDQLKRSARRLVDTLLARRLQSGGISSSRPDFYFTSEPQEPQSFSGGFQVRVKTWRHWSDAWVQLDAKRGEITGWAVDRYADPPNEAEMDPQEALTLAQQSVKIPDGAEVSSIWHYLFATQRKVVRIEWRHLHQGLRVDGDYMWVVIHPRTKRVIEWACKWREARLRERRPLWQAFGLAHWLRPASRAAS